MKQVSQRLTAEPGAASTRMSRQARHDTVPELRLRSELHRRGLRYTVHRRPLPDLRREADIVFPRLRVAVFVNGCFWHGCDRHRTDPVRNAEFWSQKIEGNRRRDQETDTQLTEFGWTVVRVWEHEETKDAADRVEQVVRGTRARLR
jgi:DNA mismatch endonuclease, patch repair protein